MKQLFLLMVAFIVRAQSKLGDISPIERARELNGYCYKHLSQPDKLALRECIDLYLILYTLQFGRLI